MALLLMNMRRHPRRASLPSAWLFALALAAGAARGAAWSPPCARWSPAARARLVACRPPLQASAFAVELDAPVPPGPDPYKLVNDEIEFIKDSIKSVLKSSNSGGGAAMSSNDVLAMAAREFMQRKGKSFRPMLVLLIGRATDADFKTGPRHSKLAVISEMIHTASLIHADVLEEGETDMSQGTLVHQEVAHDVGNKVCILAGDFLLAKAAVELSLLESSPVTEIIARGLEAVCEGGMMLPTAADGAAPVRVSLPHHLEALEQSVAELIANSCACAAILSGHEPSSPVARACHSYGESLGMCMELMGEADEVEAAARKCRRHPAKLLQLLPTTASTPLILAAEHAPASATWLHADSGAASTAASAAAYELLEQSSAVRRTRELAAEYAQTAADSLGALPNSATRDALLVLCHKILNGAPLK